jgi:patatin-like phospholipase/acyl hydrolase
VSPSININGELLELTILQDGGGVKGLTSLRILQQTFIALEKEVGQPVQPHEYFDLIGGTSTGG